MSCSDTSLTWLVFGGKGWIGTILKDLLKKHRPQDYFLVAKSRADDEVEVEKEIMKVLPDQVICLVGRTHGQGIDTIDYLEQKGKIRDNVRDNLFAPLVLSTICNRFNIHLTYLGTGCIFTYDQQHVNTTERNPEHIQDAPVQIKGFTEGDRPNFFGSSYSVVKGFTDRLLHLLDFPVLNVRIRMPITSDRSKRNFITKITTYDKICSIENSMSVLPELLPIMIDMAVKKRTGTINLTNPGTISHNRILELYREIVDPEFTWKNFTIEEQGQILASERSNNFLDTTLLKDFAPYVNNIEVSVTNVLIEIKKNDQQIVDKAVDN